MSEAGESLGRQGSRGNWVDALPWLGWPLLAVSCLAPLLLDRPPVDFLTTSSALTAFGRVGVVLALAGVIAVRAVADGTVQGKLGTRVTLGLAVLALLMALLHWAMVDSMRDKWGGQRDLYYRLLNHTHEAPHQYRPLPYGFTRLLERCTHSWDFACLAYRWFFTFWFLWAAQELARRFLGTRQALLVVGLLCFLYPLSIARYMGQLTDPLSHMLFVLGILAVIEDRPWTLALALFFGVLAKETAVLLVPAYLACSFRQGGRAVAVTGFLGVVATMAFLVARVPFGWWPGYQNINGTTGLMIGTNLGFGEPIALTSVTLLENYFHPLLFIGPFVFLLAWYWPELDPRLLTACLVLTPLLLLSNLCFGWMYESRNYMPLVPLLATTVLAQSAAKSHWRSRRTPTGA